MPAVIDTIIDTVARQLLACPESIIVFDEVLRTFLVVDISHLQL